MRQSVAIVSQILTLAVSISPLGCAPHYVVSDAAYRTAQSINANWWKAQFRPAAVQAETRDHRRAFVLTDKLEYQDVKNGHRAAFVPNMRLGLGAALLAASAGLAITAIAGGLSLPFKVTD